jgi:hypothetical protein
MYNRKFGNPASKMMVQSAVKKKKKRNGTLVQTGDSGSAMETVINEQPDAFSFDYQ